MNFEHVTLGQRVLFGFGKAAEHLAAEAARLDSHRVMVIASPSQAPTAARITADIEVALHYDDVAAHVPVEKAEKARIALAEHGIDLLVCVGGGSTIGLAKAIALTAAVPILAVPTTYSGSEATNVWGLTQDGRKTTGIDDDVLPETVIYDAQLSTSLPSDLSVASGLNALAHCVDSMWGPRADPINQALGLEGIRALTAGLPAVKRDPTAIEGREQLLYGAYLAAVAFASAGSGMHHKICHVLGGTWNMPHAQTHAVVLPYVLAFNAAHAKAAEARMATAFGAPSALQGLLTLRETLEAPRALSDYGFTAAHIEEAVQLILPVIPASNPRRPTSKNLTALLIAATAGEPPEQLSEQLPRGDDWS